jgi:hypothetical protein
LPRLRASTANYRGTTFMPSLLNNAAVTPSPFFSFPFLFIHPHPQDGLFCFSQAFLILNFRAISKEAKAPRRRKAVTSFPLLEITGALPARTSFPSPCVISIPVLGMDSPPRTSGQMGMAFPLFTSFSTLLFWELLPS